MPKRRLRDFKPAILDALTTMRQKELGERQSFKAAAYEKVIRQLQKIPEIRTMADIDDAGVTGIGKKIRLKLEEIFETGQLAAAEEAKQTVPVEALETLSRVYGIGPVKAHELIHDGIDSIPKLRKVVEEEAATGVTSILSPAQRAGLEYYEDLLKRIPRAEMKQHEHILLTTLHDIDPTFRATIVGSYRRGAATSGDIDCLVAAPVGVPDHDQREIFAAFVETLIAAGYIRAVLARGARKCMAIASVPGPRGRPGAGRRLDLLLTPATEFPYAILYFTGSDQFNIAMRRWALSRGYSLSEHGMVAIQPDVPPVPPMKTERDIFRFLKFPWKAPEDRNQAPGDAEMGAKLGGDGVVSMKTL